MKKFYLTDAECRELRSAFERDNKFGIYVFETGGVGWSPRMPEVMALLRSVAQKRGLDPDTIMTGWSVAGALECYANLPWAPDYQI